MTTASLVTDLVTAFKNEGRIVIVGRRRRVFVAPKHCAREDFAGR
jgi:hypothetical protein